MTGVSAPPSLVGQLLDGRYKIVREIALGGMSNVYEAMHVKIGRTVAIKVLHREMAGDPEVVRRFLNEARAVGSFGHPNIVASTDFGELAGHVPYLVLEYLQGHTLAREVQTEGPLPIRRAVHIALQIASALEAAHARNVIHRDLTSANIFLVKSAGNPDHVKVLDFGISKFLEATGSSPKTLRGLTMGTPEYMAPEQISDPDVVDHRVDVYALGVIMYLMLAGTLPFSRTPLQSLLTQIVVEPPPPINRQIPDELLAILAKALAKVPAERFTTVRLMSIQLQALWARNFSAPAPGGVADLPGVASGERSRPVPIATAPKSGSTSRPTAISGSIPASTQKPPAVVVTADPKIGTRGGRGLIYSALVLAVASAGGVVFLGLRSQRGGEPPAPIIIAAPEPTPLAPASPPEPTMVHVGITSATRAARATLRGRTYLLPLDQDFKAGSEPEVVEVTAPGREGRRFWIVFDGSVTLAADLAQGQGVVEATKEQTVIALGGKPVGGEPPAQTGPSDKSEVGGAPHAHGHRSPGDKLTLGQGAGPVDDGLASSNAEPKAVAAPDFHKSAAPAPTDKPEPPTPAKPVAAAAPSKPAAPAAAPAPSKQVALAAAPAPSKPSALAAAPAPSKPAAQVEAPAPSKPAAPTAAPAPSKPAAPAAAPAASKPAAPAGPPAPSPITPKAGTNPPATATATTTAPAAAGGRLDQAKTQALVKSHLSQVQRCYRWGRTDDQMQGRVTLRIWVSVTGTVTSAKVESSSLHSSVVESCIVEAVRSWKFPAPVGGPAVALYPFDLH